MKALRRGTECPVLSFIGRLTTMTSIGIAAVVSAQTNTAVIVSHAPALNGGRLEGSLQLLRGESSAINSGTVVTGDYLVPGTPTVRLNGHPTFGGVVPGAGAITPSGYTITLNDTVSLRYVRTRTDPSIIPAVAAPPSPAGTRNVTLNSSSQSVGNFATLRNLTLNANVGMIPIPPGTYGSFTANSGSGFVLGVNSSQTPVAYNLQGLILNGVTEVRVISPVILTVACGVTLNGAVGNTNRAAWLQLRVASGGRILNASS